MTEITTDILKGGINIESDVINTWADDSILYFITNIGLFPNFNQGIVGIEKKSGYLNIGISFSDMFTPFEIFKYPFTGYGIKHIRILFHNEFCSVYIDYKWAYTFSFSRIHYPSTLVLKLYATDTIVLGNFSYQELSDWRDAIYIDLETSSMNAIQSVIQQRPVQINGKSDGSISFYYDKSLPDQVPINNIRSHSISYQDTSMMASDAIVYFSDVAVISDQQTALNIGFITRMYRMSELDSGALRAANQYQKVARQSTKQHKVVCRFCLAVEIGDLAVVSYTKSGTQTVVLETFIVESIQVDMANGQSAMTLQGRDYNV